ncbi:MAG: hypothetical protein ABUL72_04670, partial [Armatimonadota bacterium]
FTLIEMLVVIFVLSLTAAFMVPKLFLARDSAKQRAFEDTMVSLVGTAKREAEAKKQVAKLKVSDQSMEVVTVDEDQVETSVRTEALPSGVTVGALSIRGQDSTAAEWSLTVYPDGRTHQASIELDESGRVRTFFIYADGRTVWREGKAADSQTDQSWEAGNLEQRTT